MPAPNLWSADTLRLCQHSRTYIQLIQSSIFAKITDQTTASQYAEAEQALVSLAERLERQVDLFHYGALTGTHACVRDVYELASSFLTNLRIWQPEPAPLEPPAPPPNPQPLTDEELMKYMERWIAENAKQTFFGDTANDGDQHDTGTPGT
jgi:hypothetical protein